MICLGANITSNLKQPVSTTINQTKLKGPVIYDDGKITKLKDTVYHSTSLKWVYHNKIGYYNLRSTANITLQSKIQTGSWGDIAFVYDQEKTISQPVFTLYIDHKDISEKAGSYAYALIPNTNLNSLKAFTPDFEIIQNDKKVQAVLSPDKRTLMLVVYESTTIQTSKFPVLKLESPGLYIFEKKEKGYLVSIADPTQKLEQISLQLGKKRIAVSMPQGLHKGETSQILIP